MLDYSTQKERRMREHRLENVIHIQRPPQEVVNYVTQPWLWDGWHPASESATSSDRVLKQDGSFEEIVSMAPLGLIPLRIRRKMHWTVLQVDAPRSIELRETKRIIEVR